MPSDVTVIDVDASEDNEPTDIQLTGYRRNSMPVFKQVELDNDGFVYMGFSQPAGTKKRRRGQLSKATHSAHSSRSTSALSINVIVISDDEDEEIEELPPPAKVLCPVSLLQSSVHLIST